MLDIQSECAICNNVGPCFTVNRNETMSAAEECHESSPSSHPLDWQPHQLLQTQCFRCPAIYACARTHAQMGPHKGSMEYAEAYCCTPTSQMNWH